MGSSQETGWLRLVQRVEDVSTGLEWARSCCRCHADVRILVKRARAVRGSCLRVIVRSLEHDMEGPKHAGLMPERHARVIGQCTEAWEKGNSTWVGALRGKGTWLGAWPLGDSDGLGY